MSAREPIAVIGTGYVGLVTAAGFAELGSEVHCVDIDEAKIEGLRRGEIPIYEPGLQELVAKHRERLHFTTDLGPALEHARLLFVAVGTPPTYSGDADLSAVHAVVGSMPASDRHALVMKSTVPVGTGASIARAFAEQGKDGFRYVSCPEFLKEGSAVADFLHPDRVVIGDQGDWAGDAVAELYAPLNAPLVRTDIASAEMVKLASNAFLATKISFINEIANVCEETGADVTEVARGMGLDARIGPQFLQAGVGYGGSCLVGEETVLARHHGRTTLLTLEDLWTRLEAEGLEELDGMLEPEGLEVLSWVPGDAVVRYLPVMHMTRRDHDGEIVDVRTKMGRRVRCTPDHPLIVSDGRGGLPEIRLAGEVGETDWLPVAQGVGGFVETAELAPVAGAIEPAGLQATEVLVRPEPTGLDSLLSRPADQRREVFTHPRGMSARCGDVRRSGTLRLDEVGRAGVTWIRVARSERRPFTGPVYSLEVPASHTFVTSDALVVHNCFPKDVSALKQLAGNSGYHFQLLNAVIEVNELQKRRVIGKLQKHLGSLVGQTIALLGLAFKPNTDDMREASSLVLAARLQADGALVRAYDPVAEDEARHLMPGLQYASSPLEAVTGADAVVLVTEWSEFTGLDWGEVARAMSGELVVDGRNALDPEVLRAAGLRYEGIGRR